MEKISVIGMARFIIPQQKYTPDCLIYRVILSYLKLKTIVSVRRNTSRILEAYLRRITWSRGLLRVFLDKCLEKNASFLQE